MNILRWILILPFSIICSILIPYLYGLLIDLLIPDNSYLKLFIFDRASFFLQGIFFIVPAYFIAPKHKKQTIIIFLIIWTTIVVFGDYYLHKTNRENIGFWNSFLRLLGAFLAYLNIKLETVNNYEDNSFVIDEIDLKEEKIIPLTQTEREALAYKIAQHAKNNPEFKEKVDKIIEQRKSGNDEINN